MTGVVDSLLNMSPALAFTLVACLVFAEDAVFVGFVIPGETAAVLGGVIASRGEVPLWGMATVVVAAAIAGDTVGYEIGKHVGPRLLDFKLMKRRRRGLARAQAFLRQRGGSAVFLGRFVAFFRAVMPALAGASRMHYPRSWPSTPPADWCGELASCCWASSPGTPTKPSPRWPAGTSRR